MTSLLCLLSEELHRQPRAVCKYWAPCRACLSLQPLYLAVTCSLFSLVRQWLHFTSVYSGFCGNRGRYAQCLLCLFLKHVMTIRGQILVSRTDDDPLPPVGPFKTSPCVRSKRLRVYVQNVPVCTGTTRTCFNSLRTGTVPSRATHRQHTTHTTAHTTDTTHCTPTPAPTPHITTQHHHNTHTLHTLHTPHTRMLGYAHN